MSFEQAVVYALGETEDSVSPFAAACGERPTACPGSEQ